MMPRDKWYFAGAIVWFAYASYRLRDLYESRDLSEDWGGLFTLGTALLFLYGAYRKPKLVEKGK